MTTTTSFTLTEMLMAFAGSSVLGAFLTEMLRKVRTKEDKEALSAAAGRDRASGEAAVIGAMAAAFTGTTSALRDEVDRMQELLDDLRLRVAEADAEVLAAAAREVSLQKLLNASEACLVESQAEVIRLRTERQEFLDRTVQQEGEIRQLHATIDAGKREAERNDGRSTSN